MFLSNYETKTENLYFSLKKQSCDQSLAQLSQVAMDSGIFVVVLTNR